MRIPYSAMLRGALWGVLLLVPAALTAQISDTTPPKLISLTISPTSVNVTTAAQNVTVTAHVTDDLAGANLMCFTFSSPTRAQSTVPSCFLMTSGTPLDGTFQGTVSVPRSSEPGTWTLDDFSLRDNAQNFSFLATSDLRSLNFPTDLAVLSTSADTQAPQVLNTSLSPPSIDVSTGPQTMTLSLTLTDNLSGVDFSRFLEFRVVLRSPSGRQEQYISGGDFQLISGTPLNGVWRASHSFPKDAEAGTWNLGFLWLSDLADNERTLSTAQLQALGLATNFTVVSTTPDTATPQVTGVSFSPLVIDTSTGSRVVTVNLNMTDDRSGTDFGPDHAGIAYFHGIEFRSPSGRQTNLSGLWSLIAGTPLNGTWQTTVTFPQFSEAGTWTADLFRLKDAVNNFFDLRAADMATRNFPTQLIIYQPNLLPDGNVGPGEGTVTDAVFGNKAQMQVPSGVLSQPTDIAIDVLSSDLGVPTPAGFQQGSFFVNFDFNPKPAMPLPSPGVTVVLPLQAQKPPGTALTLFRLDPVAGAVPAERAASCPSLISSVNADGLSATFTCVVHFSTLVAFLPTAVLGDVNGDGKVDCSDLAIVKASFGKRTGQTGFDSRADLNRDGVVNVIDLAIVSRQLPAGTTCP